MKTELKFEAIPQGAKAYPDVTAQFDAAAEGGMAQRSLLVACRGHVDGAKTDAERREVLFRIARSYSEAVAKWDAAHPLAQFEGGGKERNKAKTKALLAPMSYLNREVIRPLGVEVAKTKEGYGLREYKADTTTDRAKALKQIENGIAKLTAKPADLKAVMKIVDAHFKAAKKAA